MDILLTGGTGFIGSAVLRALGDHGHTVTALVRSDASARKVEAAGARPLVGDLTDITWLTDELAQHDGAIHTASPGDETSPAVDRAVAEAAVAAFFGTGKRYVHTSGVWIYGPGDILTEQTPFDPPAIVAWREEVEHLVVGSDDVNGVIVAPGVVYGMGKGLPNLLIAGPRTKEGALTLIGDGSQHWVTVHVDDLADLYVLALERGKARERYIGAGGDNPTVWDLGLVISTDEDGGPGVAAEPVEKTQARIGDALADALLQSQQATGAKARRELGWEPVGPTLAEDLAEGSYAFG